MLSQVLAAVLAHLWFRNHEPTLLTAVCSLIVLPLFPPLLEDQISRPQGPFSRNFTQFSGIVPIALQYLVFWSSLAVSITIYRLSPFHPLAQYPGPILCRVTKLWSFWYGLRGDMHRYVQHLHQQYGPVIRLGPNELCIAEKDAVPHVLGSQGMPRGPMWVGRRARSTGNYDTVINVRDLGIHSQLRKPWNQAFSADPVKDYGILVEIRAKELRDHLQSLLKAKKARDVNLARWMGSFSFDFLGSLAFGGCFELMRDGDVEGFLHLMERGLELPYVHGQIPWIRPLLSSIPFLSSGLAKFSRFCAKQSSIRISLGAKYKDLFYHLYEVPAEQKGRPVEADMGYIITNSLLVVIAGSDTTTTTLTGIFCHLLSNRKACMKLQSELDEAFPFKNVEDGWPEIEIDKLTKLLYLNAVINEGLRLVPVVPTNIQRSPEPGSGGKMLGDTNIFIPEGTAVNITPYSLHRDPRYFSPSPEAFIPERWLPAVEGEPRYTTIREAHIPFSYGPANCAGKPLALLELRYVVAVLVRSFDFHHASCKDASAEVLEGKTKGWVDSLQDRYAFKNGPLYVDISLRV